MRQRLIDISAPECLSEWQQYSRLKLPYVFAPTQASYKFEDGTVIGSCARKVYYEQLKYNREQIADRAYSIFDHGYSFEERQLESFKVAGIYVADHVPLSFHDPERGIYVSGEADAIVKLDGKLVGVEFKTSYGYKFLHNQILGYKRSTKGDRPYLLDPLSPAPKPEHILQVMCYLYYFSFKAEPPVPYIDEWRIVYEDRGTCAKSEFVVYLDDIAGYHVPAIWHLGDTEGQVQLKQITVEGILDRYKYVYDCIISHKVPEPDFDVHQPDKDWQCGYCLFKNMCIEDN